eukprot:2684043-Pyramimonas_sp.AAC.1
MFKTSSHKWTKAQRLNEARTGHRDFRVKLRLDHYYTQPALDHFKQLIVAHVDGKSPWNCVPMRYRTSELRCYAFRVLSRAVAGLNDLLIWPEERFPFRLHRLLDAQPGDDMRAMRDSFLERPCVLDPVSHACLKQYSSSLGSPEARAELRLMAILQELCIGRIESRWSMVRRFTKLLSLQTCAADLKALSANFIATCTRLREGGIGTAAAHQDVEGKAPARCRRKYHSWNAFCHDRWAAARAEGLSFKKKEDFCLIASQALTEYRGLTPQQRQHYERRAAVAQSRRERGLPPWSTRSATRGQALRDAA